VATESRAVIPVIRRGSLNGLTILQCDSATGWNTAALVFRVGRFDETLAATGITHLIEHLSLSARPKASYQFNAEVSGRFTSFFMESADPADISDFIATVSRGLAAGYQAELELEKRILRTEAASRGEAGALGACLTERYGAAGPGLVSYDELGLHRLGWGEIEAWRRYWFVAGNAVLWIHGAVPSGLRADLPPGPARPMAPLRPLTVGLPGYVVAGRGGVGVSLTAPQSPAASLALDILRERLTRVLRYEHGLSYGVQVAREGLDAELSHAWLTADALPEQQPMLAHAMLTAFEALAADGSRPEEAPDYARRVRGAFESPAGPAAVLGQQARDLLCGRPPRSPGQAIQAISALGPALVRAAARDLSAHMIVATPALIPAVQGRMPRLPVSSRQVISGTTLVSADSPARLTFGPEGVMLTLREDQHVTVAAGAVAALICWNDGQRTLVGGDGFTLTLDPEQWPDGARVVGAIEASVDPRLRVGMDAPGPSRARPAAPGPSAPPAAAPPRPSVLERLVRLRGLLLVWLLVGLSGLVQVSQGNVAPGLAVAAAGAAGVAGQRVLIRRLARRRHARAS
jgi:predicted Zn-dependent peptidase